MVMPEAVTARSGSRSPRFSPHLVRVPALGIVPVLLGHFLVLLPDLGDALAQLLLLRVIHRHGHVGVSNQCPEGLRFLRKG